MDGDLVMASPKHRILKDVAFNILMERTLIDETTGCWLWQGARINNGHGSLRINNQHLMPHRLSAMLYHGLDINNAFINANHIIECPNKHCWNPEHIYVGNQFDNMQDNLKMGIGIAAKRKARSHCNRGHEYTPENTYITVKNVRMCRACRNLKVKELRKSKKSNV